MPYIGEIRMFAGDFAPVGWMFCEGQTLAISEFEGLFQLIGTMYGGDGVRTFALPDLRGRLPVHPAQGLALASAGGAEHVALVADELPVHAHELVATQVAGDAAAIGGNVLAAPSGGVKPYLDGVPSAILAEESVSPAGGSAAHPNLQPYLCLHFVISLFGVFPSPS